MLNPGVVLQNRYRIERLAGQGGMGVVYLARQIHLDRPVALKAMLPADADPGLQQMFVRQFKKEARILASLKHAALVDVLDFFEDDGGLYLVMEYVEGEALSSSIRGPARGARIEQVLTWASQLVAILHYLHHHSPPVIVRDLKPNNLMLETGSGRIRLIDFGIARELRPTPDSAVAKVFATSGFAPPEQYAGATDVRTDLYGLGATLYALLTAKVPPNSLSRLGDDVVLASLTKVNPRVSPALASLVFRLMALDPGERPQSVDEAANLLALATQAQADYQPSAESTPTDEESADRPWPAWALPLTVAATTQFEGAVSRPTARPGAAPPKAVPTPLPETAPVRVAWPASTGVSRLWLIASAVLAICLVSLVALHPWTPGAPAPTQTGPGGTPP